MAEPVAAETPAELLDQLRAVLDVERRALLAGSAEEIAAAARHKLDLAERIERRCTPADLSPADRESLAALERHNRENGAICSAMLRQLADALDHLRAHELHHSYTSDGSEQRRPPPHPLGAA